jgi:hypothetical protein
MYADKMLAGSVALIAAFWVAICAAAPEVIWEGLRIAVGHLTRADLLSALLLGLILAFFVEPLLRRTGDFFGPSRRASAEERRNPLFTAGLSLAFALVSVCVLDATSAFVSGRADTIGEPSGLAAAIALTTAWSIVPFAISLAWLSVRNRWLRVPIGVIAGTDEPDAARSHGAPLGDTTRQKALRPAQAHPGTGVRHHQIGSGLPTIPVARPRQSPRRVEPGDDGLQHEADLRPRYPLREHWAIVTQPPPGQPATLRQVSNPFSLALSTQLGVPALDQPNSSPTGC